MFIPQAYSPSWEPATIFGVRFGPCTCPHTYAPGLGRRCQNGYAEMMLFSSRIGIKPLVGLCRRLSMAFEAGIDARTIWKREAERRKDNCAATC